MSAPTTNPAPTVGAQRAATDPQRRKKPARHANHEHEEVIPKDLKQPHTFTVVLAVVVFAALLGILFFVGYRPHKQAQERSRRGCQTKCRAWHRPTVEVVHIPKRSPPRRNSSSPADVHANQDTSIFPRTQRLS